MDYIEITLKFETAEPWKDIFTNLLAEIGCDSFMDGETEDVLLAYIPENLFDKESLQELLSNHEYPVSIDFHFSKIETQDWNAVWESNYNPVLIAEKCYIRAPFHEPNPEAEYEIVIEPKMSFGTAHHETTALMMEYLLEENLKGKSLMDMGAGTGILAILAHKRKASPVVAIDNDEWAYRNNLENNEKNDIQDMTVILGDAQNIPEKQFDIFLANINRNILLNDIPVYQQFIKQNGILLLSGFYLEPDLEMLKAKCAEHGLLFDSFKMKNNWTAARFVKR